jgi:hypothetical protein
LAWAGRNRSGRSGGCCSDGRIGKATFAVPRSTGAFGIAAANAWDGNVTFQNVSVDIGLWHVEVPSIVISGTQASKSDIAALFDSRSSIPTVERLTQLNAKTVDIPTVTVGQSASLGSTGTTTLKRISARDIQGGKIASLTVAMADLQLRVDQPPNTAAPQPRSGQWGAQSASMDVNGSYGRATFTNVNLTAV